MSDERIKSNPLLPKVRPSIEDLVTGTILTIQQRGFEVRRVVYETDRLGFDKRRGHQRIEAVFHDVQMPERSFPVSYAAVLRGELGPTRIIGIESKRPVKDVSAVNIDRGIQTAGFVPELGTDMVTVALKEAPEDGILAVISAMEGNMAILGLPEKPARQFLMIDREDLLRGETEQHTIKPVAEKFSLLKEAPELEERAAEADKIHADLEMKFIPSTAVDPRTVVICPDYQLADEFPEFDESRVAPSEEILGKQIDTSAQKSIMERRRGKRGKVEKILNALWDIRSGNAAVAYGVRSLSIMTQ